MLGSYERKAWKVVQNLNDVIGSYEKNMWSCGNCNWCLALTKEKHGPLQKEHKNGTCYEL